MGMMCSDIKLLSSTLHDVQQVLQPSIIVFCGTHNILWNIFTFILNVGIILQNIISSTEHCYGYE
jgi:hypothetical protein